MGIQTKWYDDTHQAIVREFDRQWTWEDFYASQQVVHEMLQSVPYDVHQIIDFSASQTLPSNILTHIGKSERNMPKNRGKSIVVIQSPLYQTMYNILTKVFPSIVTRVVLVKTREEAEEILHKTVESQQQ